MDFFDLRFDQVKVVKQPCRCRTYVIAGTGLQANVTVGFTQGENILLQAREEGGCKRACPSGTMRRGQAAAMLGKTLRSKYLGAHRRQHRASRAIEHVKQRWRRVRKQSPQPAL